MGLDQYAYTRDVDQKPDDAQFKFCWRKHAKLQEFMEQLFCERTHSSIDALNCGELALTSADILQLRTLTENNDLPESPGGFFYGHDFQAESAAEYRQQDLEFCDWALQQIRAGHQVYYSCWW